MSLIHWNKSTLLAGLLTAALSAQTYPVCGINDSTTLCTVFDNSGTSMLSGTYFIREIQLSNVSTNGTSVGLVFSLYGTMTFTPTTDTTGVDNGTYTFSGEELEYEKGASPAITGPTAYSYTTGSYRVSANGMLALLDPITTGYSVTGVLGAAGPNAFIASSPNSASSGANFAIIVGIPVGGTALSGNYYGSYFDFHGASVSSIREASFPFTSNGNGSLGNLTITGAGTDLGDAIMTQALAGVSYSFSSNVGTLNFGGSATSNFISGTQTFYVSTDGSIIVGGTPGDFDLLVGVQALAGALSNASLSGVYLLGGIEDNATQPNYTIFNAFYGSTSATGTGTSITHRTMASSTLVNPAYRDYTTAVSGYTISSDAFAPGDGYQYFLGTNGTFLGTGQAGLYSMILGMLPPAAIQKPTGSLWLNPLGIVNAANYAGVTNPVAPNEVVQLYGTGFASSAVSAPLNATLPTSLNNVQVYVNGGDPGNNYAPAPLLYVSPTVINMVAPSNWYPVNGWPYDTFQVCVGTAAACSAGTGTYSNPVRVLAQNSAPSVFTLNMQGTGQADVLNANTGLVADSANPAHPGDMVSIFATGLGITVNQPNDGSVGIDSPMKFAWQVWMGGVQCNPNLFETNYAGLAPGYTAGVYELNVTVPSGTGFGSVPLEIWTTEGQTIQTTIYVEPAQVGAVKR